MQYNHFTFMDLTDHDHTPEESAGSTKIPLLVDKQEVIKVLQDLVAQYPSDEIPLEVIESALAKFLGPRDIGRLSHHPAIEKLDKILAQFRNPHPPQ
jgi:hypothetical protein